MKCPFQIRSTPRTKYEDTTLMARMRTEILHMKLNSCVAPAVQKEGILDVLNAHCFRSKNDSDDVEPEGVARLLKTRNPDLRRTAQLTLLAPVHSPNWSAERIASACLHFDERYRAHRVRLPTLGDQIDVTMSVPKAMLDDAPAVDSKPLRRHPLSSHAHRLTCRCHGPNVATAWTSAASNADKRKRFIYDNAWGFPLCLRNCGIDEFFVSSMNDSPTRHSLPCLPLVV